MNVCDLMEFNSSGSEFAMQVHRGLLHDHCTGTLKQSIQCRVFGTDWQPSAVKTDEIPTVLDPVLNGFAETLQSWKRLQKLRLKSLTFNHTAAHNRANLFVTRPAP